MSLIGSCEYFNLLPHAPRCCGVCRRRPIRALWTAQSEFSELVMEKNMIRDHDMYYVQKMLLKLQKQEKLNRK